LPPFRPLSQTPGSGRSFSSSGDAIHASCDALEGHIAELDEAGLAALDITSDDHWPS
jgi:hypothetical protein